MGITPTYIISSKVHCPRLSTKQTRTNPAMRRILTLPPYLQMLQTNERPSRNAESRDFSHLHYFRAHPTFSRLIYTGLPPPPHIKKITLSLSAHTHNILTIIYPWLPQSAAGPGPRNPRSSLQLQFLRRASPNYCSALLLPYTRQSTPSSHPVVAFVSPALAWRGSNSLCTARL